MKTKEELNALKNEVEALNTKLAELSEEELAQVAGGAGGDNNCVWILKGASPDLELGGIYEAEYFEIP